MATIKQTNQILFNLEAFLNRLFIENGYYYPVDLAETDPDALDMSLLEVQTDEYPYADNTIWQSRYKPWVYEDGVSVPSGQSAITYPSGIYIDGVFSASGVHYDYINGRVILDSALVGDEAVQVAGMSYKHISVILSNEDNFITNKSTSKNSPDISGTIDYPDDIQVQPPAVIIEFQRSSPEPWQIGGGKKHFIKIFIHIFATTNMQLNDITDVIYELKDTGFKMIDWNTAPERLDLYGDKAATFETFTVLQENYYYNTLFFREIDVKSAPETVRLKRSLVEMSLEMYSYM